MIPIQSLSRFIVGTALQGARNVLMGSVKKTVTEEAKKVALISQLQEAKKALAEQIAENFSKQVKERSEAYIETIKGIELEVDFNNTSKNLDTVVNNVIKQLDDFLETEDEESPVIKFLQKRYNEEKINIITGRLYAGHYVRRKEKGNFSVGNKMLYAPYVDKNRPWLSSERTTQGIEEIIAKKTDELFDEAFKNDRDISSEEIDPI